MRDPQLPRLRRELVAHDNNREISLPAASLLDLPEKAVQFGTGAFLRGFVDVFLDSANRQGMFGGRIVAIGSTPSGRDVALNDQDGLYTVVVEGVSESGTVRENRVIASVSRALAARRDWAAILELARNPALELVFSNTTEVGIALDERDRLDDAPPLSFPAKLTRFLLERGRTFDYADNAGVVIIPCELVERNGDQLRELVLTVARRWNLDGAFHDWIARAVPFCNTLVDRIVPGTPDDARRQELERAFGYQDELMIIAEPYRLFAIEADASVRGRLLFASADTGVVLTEDVTPYRERKVRILNGGHTLVASIGLLLGCETVIEAVRHDMLGVYLRRVLALEIVPTLDVPNAAQFASDVLTRFANPFLRHALKDIAFQHTAKVRMRIVPSIVRYGERTGSVPRYLAFGFAAYLLLMRESPPATDSEGGAIRSVWREVRDDSHEALRALVNEACSRATLWHADLSRVPGFAEHVLSDLAQMRQLGVGSALENLLDRNDTARPALASSSSTRS
jgi:tagaturonate reductase